MKKSEMKVNRILSVRAMRHDKKGGRVEEDLGEVASKREARELGRYLKELGYWVVYYPGCVSVWDVENQSYEDDENRYYDKHIVNTSVLVMPRSEFKCDAEGMRTRDFGNGVWMGECGSRVFDYMWSADDALEEIQSRYDSQLGGRMCDVRRCAKYDFAIAEKKEVK